MPTYEYECQACKKRFEEFQSITAKPLKTCPSCKKKKLKRLISAGAGFIFKGSGFYITDYRSDNYKAGEKNAPGAKTDAPKADSPKTDVPAKTEAAPAPAKTETKSEPKTESKPAPPAPAKASSSAKKK